MVKMKILCICSKGRNRSKYLAEYLKKNHSTRYGGLEVHENELKDSKPITQEDIDWAEILIIVKKRLENVLKNNFEVKNKKLIILDVLDSQKLISKTHPELKNISYEEFNKKYTWKKLKEEIDKFKL
jgi:predicted protein tyrosine phosphatase